MDKRNRHHLKVQIIIVSLKNQTQRTVVRLLCMHSTVLLNARVQLPSHLWLTVRSSTGQERVQ